MGKKKTSRWNELCESVKEDDGLPTRESGPWAKEKLWYWNRYTEITTQSMVGKPAWKAGVVYVDLFAGPGVCTIRGTNERCPGSPLIAAGAPKPFTKILLCEKDKVLADACESRLAERLPAGQFGMFAGDCNSRIDELCSEIPPRALTLAFLDPTGLHLWFETVQTLSRCGRVDLLILLPDAVDIMRNVDQLYFEQPDSNLDRVLGPDSNWREAKAKLESTEPSVERRLYASIYELQLRRHAGYKHFAEEVIQGPHGPLYRLIYATKHPRGIDFWDKSIKKEFGGQQRLPF